MPPVSELYARSRSTIAGEIAQLRRDRAGEIVVVEPEISSLRQRAELLRDRARERVDAELQRP